MPIASAMRKAAMIKLLLKKLKIWKFELHKVKRHNERSGGKFFRIYESGKTLRSTLHSPTPESLWLTPQKIKRSPSRSGFRAIPCQIVKSLRYVRSSHAVIGMLGKSIV